MTRISLKEAYNNRDVIAWLVKHEDAIDELENILKDITPDGDLTNVVTKTGDQTIDGEKTFIGKIIADCDIIQNGSAYETHAEQVFSHNDLMIMRDGAINALAQGEFSGLQIQKYDGASNGRMVMDNTGIMRVGDINDEKPLLVRDEAADLQDGDLLQWDAAELKAKGIEMDTSPTAASTNPVMSGGVRAALDSFDLPIDSVGFTPVSPLTLSGTLEVKSYGKFVSGYVQLNVNGMTLNGSSEYTIGNLAKGSREERGAGYVGTGSSGITFITWVNSSGKLKIYTSGGALTSESFLFIPIGYIMS